MYNQIWRTLHLDALKITETKACNNNLKTKRNNSVPSMDLTRRKGERGGGGRQVREMNQLAHHHQESKGKKRNDK